MSLPLPRDVDERLRSLLAQVMDVEPAQVGAGFGNATCASWTSLKHLMLVSQLESSFDVMFSNREIPELTSYEAITAVLARRLGQGQA
ncbi:MAG: acyl carrier protein [Gemmatimonadaceae bacterium]